MLDGSRVAVIDQGMEVTIVFWVLIILCCGYAALFGGAEGRCASILILAAVITTGLAQMLVPSWTATHLPILTIDVLLWLGLLRLMLNSRHYWPIWMAAAQTLTVTTHLATGFIADFDQGVYAGLGTVWAIPCLLSMVVGIALDNRRKGSRPR